MGIEQLETYAPYILVAVAFLANYKIFVTPKDLEEKLKDYVLKETYSITISEMKADIDEIKTKINGLDEKFNRIYEKLING